MIELLSRLRYRSEGPDIDFKSAQYRFNGGSEADKAEMLKDILAIANSWREGAGYILLGFKDNRPHPAEVVGIQDSIDDSRIQQFVNSKVKPKLTFSYEEHLYEGMTVGVITIPKQKRPFYLTNAYGRLKSNVVYVRRGSSTDEAEPPEATAMAINDDGRKELKLDLSVLTPQNEPLPSTFAHKYLRFTEAFPDYVRARQPIGPFGLGAYSALERDNRDYWREYAEYVRVDEALIEMQFVLVNRSSAQLSNAKLEVFVDVVDAQSVEMLPGCDLPEKPESEWRLTDHITTVQDVMARHNPALQIDGRGPTQACHIRIGSLLPGEQGRSETLALIPHAPGTFRLRLRILGSELPEPLEQELVIETAGEVDSLNFKQFKQFVREQRLADQRESAE
ncbi:transcriptional regulator [Stutzerimonas xanthomarina]|uniref:AlbA family DNA-binding domain-containing protein n=1 Tax=Stutzerimonas stutzeri TaxID=316 RepID=UPI000824328A|nr:ATP-binding protein [Stutzerimonas stutzeri]MDH0427545.1 ATP-binding protein [Stutzerimonas stutzeri]OCX20882.1 transcriptional regulator [Stutzerimonas xanthomarina]